MSEKTFDEPVFVRATEGLVEEITCLEDALEFLYEWPKSRRGPIYQTALRACQKVFESNYPLGAARLAFISFAKSARILEDVNVPMPWMLGRAGHGGGVTA